MRNTRLALFAFVCAWALLTTNALAAGAAKEWTMLVFLNGHNNLDSFGAMNIKQMEKIGSTKDVDVVVQWASLKNGKTKRLHIAKSSNPNSVTSPVVESLPAVDMGDYKQLVEFVRWSVKRYPAKKYFIDVWNHGNGWHRRQGTGNMQPNDISYDDNTGNKITTEQLALAMKEIADLTGNKVELYGSDACLMAMAEVGAQMADSVKFFAGSQETEPAEGWPYTELLERWVKDPTIDGGKVATILSEEYLKAYSGGIYGTQSVTFSAYDLQKIDNVYNAFFELSRELIQLNKGSISDLKDIAEQTQAFYNSDYKDARDFIDRVQKSGKFNRRDLLDNARLALESLVVANQASRGYPGASGTAIWLPTDSSDWSTYGKRYSGLVFHQKTNWGDFLRLLSGQ